MAESRRQPRRQPPSCQLPHLRLHHCGLPRRLHPSPQCRPCQGVEEEGLWARQMHEGHMRVPEHGARRWQPIGMNLKVVCKLFSLMSTPLYKPPTVSIFCSNSRQRVSAASCMWAISRRHSALSFCLSSSKVLAAASAAPNAALHSPKHLTSCASADAGSQL
jgi:hypothetical protein